MDKTNDEKQYYVYMLKCVDGTLYTGITNDPEKRLKCHNKGKASKYTRSRLPVKMVYKEEIKGKGKALTREREIKKLPRENKLKLMETAIERK